MSETKKTYEELCAEATANLHGDYTEFDGQNCQDCLEDGDTCAGWDGIIRRCQCGNRRVYWEMDNDGDGVHAVAY